MPTLNLDWALSHIHIQVQWCERIAWENSSTIPSMKENNSLTFTASFAPHHLSYDVLNDFVLPKQVLYPPTFPTWSTGIFSELQRTSQGSKRREVSPERSKPDQMTTSSRRAYLPVWRHGPGRKINHPQSWLTVNNHSRSKALFSLPAKIWFLVLL